MSLYVPLSKGTRHGVGDQRRVAMVGDDRGQGVDQVKPAVGTGQQQNAAVGADWSAIERGDDFLLANTLAERTGEEYHRRW